MELKKKIKNFFTLTRKANGGFTLVELIVVIAILAILAGVGSAGYGAYIKASNKNSDRVLVGNIRQALESYNNSGAGSFVVEGQYSAGLQIPVGYVVVSYEENPDGNHVAVIAAGADGAEVGTDNVLADAIKAAYGKEYANTIRLKYDGWDGTVNGLFFENAAAMVASVQQTGGDVLSFMKDDLTKINIGIGGIYYEDGAIVAKLGVGKYSTEVANVPIISKDYADSAELLLSVSEKVSAVDRDAFINGWDSANEEGAAFGVNTVEGAGREHYSAVRAAYNNCFANYVKSKGDSFTIGDKSYNHASETHSVGIAGHGENAMELVASKIDNKTVSGAISKVPNDTVFPQTVCASVLAGGNGSSYTSCNACKALLAEYKASEQDKADAASFYDTMTTGAADGSAHYDPKNPEAFYAWLQASANSFKDMYAKVNAYTTGSSIVLEVYYNATTHLLDVRMCPLAADPRN